ncbi:uncharacterized protein LOC120688847 [Panicum virgatum]|uniref:uncharacterized protein LOC120688847 n=1 Tax=Panicum virgatum TaxID=38727 RepID=UPI0019D5A074|nr:uncharacterized protein LOC120688847 [Panicum virgatum]
MAGNDEETMGFFSQAHSHWRFDTDTVDVDFSQASSAHAGGTHKSCALKMDLCTAFHQFAPAADPAVFAEKLEEKHAGEEVQEQAEADPRTMARDQADRCWGVIPPGSSLGTAVPGRSGGGRQTSTGYGGDFSTGLQSPMCYAGDSSAGRGFCMPLGASLPRGRGRGTSRGGGRGRERPSSSAADASDADDDEDIEDEDECGPDGKNKFDKARWTEQNTFILCEIAVEELRDGNCVKGAWTTRGYQNLKNKYFERAGLKHTTKQIKNRFTTLKRWYVAWVWLGCQTGKGFRENGEIAASTAWWNQKISDSNDEQDSSGNDGDDSSGVDTLVALTLLQQMERRKNALLACLIGTCHLDSYSNKAPRRIAIETGIEWVMRTLGNPTDCYDTFRVSRPLFEKLHNVESKISDIDFDKCDHDENYVPLAVPRSEGIGTNESDSAVMNLFRDWVADGLWSLK